MGTSLNTGLSPEAAGRPKKSVALFDAKPYDRDSFEKTADAFGLTFKYFDFRLSPETVNLANGFDAVCAFVNDDVGKDVLDRLTEMGISVVALRSAGYNNVDLAAAYGNVHVLRVPAYSPHAVAEHAMALLLTSIRRIHKAYIRTRDFNFSLQGLTGFDLFGKTVGVVGTGRIGRCFINICKGFGMNVLAYDPFPAPDADFPYVSVEELFRKSDVISLHCPLTENTYHLVRKETIGLMKKGVAIVNTSRGGLIDSEALLEGIKERKIGTACLDVYEEESDLFFNDFSGHILSDDTLARLISMPNVIVTSHQAFLTEEALKNIAETTCSNLKEYFETGACVNELCYRCGRQNDCRHSRQEKCF